MPDEEVKLGADAPAVEPPDMTKYYYPPGATEPVLRPEFSNTTAETTEATPLKGRLPDDFPGHSALEAAGLTTYAKVRKELSAEKPFDEVDGIGPATAEKIREALGQSSEEEEGSE